jgi:Glycosyl transferase 4-like domain
MIVSYHFYPSNEIGARRATALAKYLVESGMRVSVVSAFGGEPIEPGAQVLPGIVAVPVPKPPRIFTEAMIYLKRRLIRRVSNVASTAPESPPGAPRRAAASILGKLRDTYFRAVYFIDQYKTWGRHALQAAVREGKKNPPTLVFSSSPPPTVLWVGSLAARRLGVPHIVDLRDPWSDTLLVFHPARPLELSLTRRIEQWVMHSAAAITSTGANVADLLIRRQPALASKTFVVRNGYDGVVTRSSRQTGGRLAILFAGELYLNRDPFPLLHALERLLSRPDIDPSRITVTFMGRSTEFAGQPFAEWLVGKRCSSVVTFMPPQSQDTVAKAVLQSTVLLNLAQHQPLSVPAKTFEHLASGRENLLLCEDDSESAKIVAGLPGVTQVDPRNSAALDRVLLDLYERHVNQGQLSAPEEKDVAPFSRVIANETLRRIITSTALIDSKESSRNQCAESH